MKSEHQGPSPSEAAGSAAEVERVIGACLARGDLKGAADAGIRGYGPSLLGFLVHVLGNAQDASDVFSEVCLNIWSHLGSFRGDSSFRTWAFRIARNAYQNSLERPERRRNLPLSQAPEVASLEEQVRTQTLPYLRTEVKDKVAALRQRLRPDERALLVLRVDRAMSWDDIARVMLGSEPEPPLPGELKKKSAALRQSFVAIKGRLRELAEQEGLLDSPEG
ncbi:RNA polymerase sigma factor [Sorangium sp. So ce131]|uniref:RNA polymerase sigma factor n=1 Tax=Sorangium sp. So ce131 TaxID=3133282 RepID=UPI003F620015